LNQTLEEISNSKIAFGQIWYEIKQVSANFLFTKANSKQPFFVKITISGRN
jgi:hypothetical protein